MIITYYRRPDGQYAERNLRHCKVNLADIGERSAWDVSEHFATHRPPEYDSGFVVTHKRSGLRIGPVLGSLAHACAIIDGLESLAPQGAWDFDYQPAQGDPRLPVLRMISRQCFD